ncbi:partner of xrn-2 protein 1-like [Tribolium madens]|uniref:partner of xrn-2 protein 1-like n=1 Tax=Tribolium madens TaxID=41895 RepID=UPI001CF73C89|nr:partner of xrn-2 protein 1-like [Tribolium madens]
MTQTYPTDWDIDKYRNDTDVEEHWQLRREFMKAHKEKFPEDYLVALATAFTNMEFMGCTYPAPLMLRVAELSKEIAMNYREVKKTKLQRTFVSASNAAENKIKKRQSDPGTYTSNKRPRQ